MGKDTTYTFKDITASLFMFKNSNTQTEMRNEEKLTSMYHYPVPNRQKEIKGNLDWWLQKEKTDIFIKEIQ